MIAYTLPGTAPGTVVLRAFSSLGGDALWTSPPVPQAPVTTGATPPLVPAPSGRWGVYGSSILDLELGTSTALPTGWQTGVVGDAVAFGTVDGAAVAATAAGLTPASKQLLAGASGQRGAAVPGTPGAVWDTAAYLVARDGSTQHLYAVPTATAGGMASRLHSHAFQ